jgi:ribonuclease D
MDTEADSLHSYPEKLCLVQIGIEGEDALVDPLAGLDLQPLLAVLARREILLHGGDYDLRLLHRSQGFVPAEVFDTMLAARLLGLSEFGLNNLARRFLGVELEKGPQRANWAKRPLTERMMAYARNDAHYLQPLADQLRSNLKELGRLDWHRQVCRQLVEEATAPPDGEIAEAWRIRSSDLLNPRAQAILRELWLWRESEALAGSRPPYFVLSHESLFDIAVAVANSESYQSHIPRRYSPRRRQGLARAVEQALAIPEKDWPEPRKHRGRRLTSAQKQFLETLHRRRDKVATRLKIDPTLIASRGTLATLAGDWEKHLPELLPWQREILSSNEGR